MKALSSTLLETQREFVMTERYRYAIEIECLACGARGAAYASEDDQPLNGLSCFSIDSVPIGFSLSRTGATFADSRILCSGCGGRAREVGGSECARVLQN
ncbi:MAG: hypothetical protein CTY15_05520 [Methylocystis sp.]|nr:MAG: hypothetical protein CTY15_05520 [Methylocystis sp.]